jgi:hypothetical protein
MEARCQFHPGGCREQISQIPADIYPQNILKALLTIGRAFLLMVSEAEPSTKGRLSVVEGCGARALP